jgi:hypothetical protein
MESNNELSKNPVLEWDDKLAKAIFFKSSPDYVIEEELQWEKVYKYSSCEVYFSNKTEPKRYWCFNAIEIGTHWNGYEYEFEGPFQEVRPVEVIKRGWVVI